MSARPDVPRLAEEDLDLLISRSLDGDLSPEEEQQLARLVALDPVAARRRDELAALVADMKALPETATPFALATRVNGNIAERAGRPGSLGGRFGFFPAPGFAKAALVVLAVVGVSIALLRPVPKRMADGPVDVLLYSPRQPAAPAPQTLIAEARTEKPASRLDDRARIQESDEKRNEAPAEERAGSESQDKEKVREKTGEKKGAAKFEQGFGNAPAAADASTVVAESAPKQKPDRQAATVAGNAVALESAGKLAAADPEAIAPAPAPAAPPVPVARAMKAAAPAHGWTVSVRGDGALRWALRRAPDTYPASTSSQPAVFRVALDASGRVASARLVGPGRAEPGLDEFVRGMVFEPLPRAAGGARDRLDKDAPAPSSSDTREIEIELAPR